MHAVAGCATAVSPCKIYSRELLQTRHDNRAAVTCRTWPD